jgi:hypothetical protein
MPKTPIDYSKTIIYKLVCKDLTITELYVGQTTNFKARKFSHKNCCTNENNIKYKRRVYQFIRENGNFVNWDMIVIHRQSCIDRYEAHNIERSYIESLNATLNSVIPNRTILEWNADNKVKLHAYQRNYHQNNKDRIIEKTNRYVAENKQHVADYQKEYSQKNKERIKEYKALYNERNKVSIKEKQTMIRQKRKLLQQQ